MKELIPGILLLSSTVLAMLLANTNFSDGYFALLHTNFFGLSVHHWINDALMTIFFFVVGMEIKRELVKGELSDRKRATLPLLAALGGMIVPALIYFTLNSTYPNVRGWGIPMATDIAFAVGALSFFGRRIPSALKIFLLALAIVDDLGAVLVIAFFYTSQISGPYLALASAGLLAIWFAQRLGIKRYEAYIFLGLVVWFAVLKSGVHATIAGVLIGLLTPLKGKESPLDTLVHFLHPYVSYLIMPIFALANAGVNLRGVEFANVIESPIFNGVAFGLLFGKPLGIGLFSLVGVFLGWAALPRGTGWGQMFGVACLAGIGFTMALFISELALYPDQQLYSKTAILLGSLASAIVGLCALQLSLRRPKAGSTSENL